MRNFKLYQFSLLIIVFAGLFLNSCNTKDEPVKPDNQYFISNEFKTEITTKQAIENFTRFSSDAASIGYFITTDVEVRKLIYKTTFQDKEIQASGLVCMPKTAGNYPILSFQNGTNTLHSQAPSEAYNDELFSTIESIASMGFIVVIPDYIGFGASSQLVHPYLDAKSTTQSILDLIRATKEYGTEDENIAKPNKDLFLFGYSQGAWATLKLQKEIETKYASEFNLIASSCGAGPYSIELINKYITSQTNYSTPYFLACMLNTYTHYGLITAPLSDFIQAPYAEKIPGFFDGKHNEGSINTELTTTMANLLTHEYLDEYATNAKFAGLRSAFTANSIAAWNTSTPTHLYHGENDNVIPISMSQKMFEEFKAKGVSESKIELISIPGASHLSGVYETGLMTIGWFIQLK